MAMAALPFLLGANHEDIVDVKGIFGGVIHTGLETRLKDYMCAPSSQSLPSSTSASSDAVYPQPRLWHPIKLSDKSHREEVAALYGDGFTFPESYCRR